MSGISAEQIDQFQNGRWRMMRVTEPGSYKVVVKDGTADVQYAAGDVILVDAQNEIIVKPTSLDGAADLAGRILEGHARSRTDPKAILALSIAVLAFRAEAPIMDPDPEPVATAIIAALSEAV